MITALGKRSQNGFLSFWEDNFFPWPFCGKKVKNDTDPDAKQKSWTRRVNVNTTFYFGTLTVLTLLNILYTVHYNYGVDVLAWKDRRTDLWNALAGVGGFEDKFIFQDAAIFGLVLQATAVYTQVRV